MRQRAFALVVAVVVLAGVAAALLGPRAAGPAPGPEVLRLEPPDGRTGMLGDGHATRLRTIVADLPSTLSWRAPVPPGARITAEVALDRAFSEALAGRTCRARVESGPEGQVPTVLVEKVVVPGEPWQTLAADLEPARAHRAELRLAIECHPAPEGGTLAGAVRWSVPTVFRPSTAGYTNVVVVTVDTLRADHLGAYGYARPTSPRIDGLARRGLLFRNAETVQSATWPALTSLHTSLHPSAHGVIWNGWRPRGRFVTLADLLHAKGYATAAFLSNMTRAEHPGFSRLYRARGGDQVRQDESAVTAAVRHLEEVRDRPFFLWLHLISPHADYAPPFAYDTYTTPGPSTVGGTIVELEAARAKGVRFTEADVARVVALYDGEVAFTDAQVGRVLDALRDLRLQERTLVVFSADHGEDLHEHNRYFFHSPSLYSSSLHVPLILALPGVLPQGIETDHPASLVDVAPTVLSLLGLPFPSSFQGKDLLPGGRLPAAPVRTVAYGETSGKIFSATTPEWRFVYNPEKLVPPAPGGPYPFGEIELYDRREDPRERANVAARRPELVEALTAEILAWRRRDVRAGGPDAPQTIDPSTAEELRALGYVIN